MCAMYAVRFNGTVCVHIYELRLQQQNYAMLAICMCTNKQILNHVWTYLSTRSAWSNCYTIHHTLILIGFADMRHRSLHIMSISREDVIIKPFLAAWCSTVASQSLQLLATSLASQKALKVWGKGYDMSCIDKVL